MRRAARTDGNQPEIIKALRAVGATVQPLHMVGKGCPDLLVGYKWRNYLMEVKDPTKPKADQNLTPDQEEWHGDWYGQLTVVKTVEGALEAIGVKPCTS